MLNILFYTSFNSRSRDTESLMQAFVQDGHRVFLLTQSPKGPYHEACEIYGVKTFAHPIKKRSAVFYYLRHAWFLAHFCRTHKIHLVYAHLENAGLPAVLAQYVMKSKVITCRHIIDEAVLLGSKNFQLQNKLVYSLSKETIVVSQRSKAWMTESEGVPAKKIRVIPLAYNFTLYPVPDQARCMAIRDNYRCELLLLCACRLMPGKRPALALEVCRKLILDGLDVKLLLLGDGPQRAELEEIAQQTGLKNRAFVLGFQPDVMDYLSACDLLVHPSVQDSSSVIIKEAGLCKKAVICCKAVGDVDEYLEHDRNAILVSRENCLNDMVQEITKRVHNHNLLAQLGRELEIAVRSRFDISRHLPVYQSIHQTFEKSR